MLKPEFTGRFKRDYKLAVKRGCMKKLEITSPQGDRKIGARPHKPEIAVNTVDHQTF